MAIWDIIFYPSYGMAHSPRDYIDSLTKKNEIAIIYRRLSTISELPIGEWPRRWVKKIGTTYQLTADNHRLYFGLDGRKLVVCHACRKVSQKALKEDLYRADANLKSYLEARRR